MDDDMTLLMAEPSSPRAVAAVVLAAFDTGRWGDVAAHCAEPPLAELRDSVARLVESLHERPAEDSDEDTANAALHAYGDDLADATMLRALAPRALFTRYLSRQVDLTSKPGPRMIEEVCITGDHALVRYTRPRAASEELQLVRTAAEWQVIPNADILAAVKLSPALWRRRMDSSR